MTQELFVPDSPSAESARSGSTVNRHVAADKICTHFDTYGLLCDEYDQLRARAKDACEVCETPEQDTARGALVIDHFQYRDVWFVRGLLCDRCNSVMSRHDRAVVWGPASLPYAEKAHEYHLNAFGRPSADEFNRAAVYIATRKPFDVKTVPRLARNSKKAPMRVRLDNGVKHIARSLLRHLSRRQLNELIELLTEDSR